MLTLVSAAFYTGYVRNFGPLVSNILMDVVSMIRQIHPNNNNYLELLTSSVGKLRCHASLCLPRAKLSYQQQKFWYSAVCKPNNCSWCFTHKVLLNVYPITQTQVGRPND